MLTDTETVDEAANDEHSDVLRSTDDDRADTPDDCADLDCALASKDIAQESGGESANKRATGHSRSDTALHIGFWT